MLRGVSLTDAVAAVDRRCDAHGPFVGLDACQVRGGRTCGVGDLVVHAVCLKETNTLTNITGI